MIQGLHLGFLAITQDHQGWCGGYLATNRFGRPLEFRLSSSVQPSRVQQILYGKALKPYVCAEVLGKTLAEKATTSVDLIIADCEAALELRRHVKEPVVWLKPAGQRPEAAELLEAPAHAVGDQSLLLHPDFPADVGRLAELTPLLEGFDLEEPFGRIREALAEARKLGAAPRAA